MNFIEIFQDKMDQLLQMIQSADPTDNQSDSVELLQLEGKLNLWLNLILYKVTVSETKVIVSMQKLIWYFVL